MRTFKLISLALSIPLSIASYQAQASHYVYNSQNQMVLIDNHKLQYAPSGELSQADTLKFIGKSQVQGNIVEARFGGVTLRSDGTYSTTFTDGHNTPKTSNDRVYSSPYGKHKPIKLDIHNNMQVFGDAYSLFGAEYMGARWYFPQFYRFGQQDTMDVSNRFNLDNDNPIMNYDPTGHMSKTSKILFSLALIGASLVSYGLSAALAIDVSAVASSEAFGELAGSDEMVNGSLSLNNSDDPLLRSTIPTEYKKTATWGGYMAANILPVSVTTYQKIKSGADLSNTLLSILIPVVAGGFGTIGLFGNKFESAFFGAVDNGIEGALYPVMQKQDMKIDNNELHEMIASFMGGLFAGIVGGNYSNLGGKDAGSFFQNYGRSIFNFGLRGSTMEAMRLGTFDVSMSLMDPNFKINKRKSLMQIYLNSPVQMLEGVIMKRFITLARNKDGEATFNDLFWANVGFNTGGAVMQFGSPAVDAIVNNWTS